MSCHWKVRCHFAFLFFLVLPSSGAVAGNLALVIIDMQTSFLERKKQHHQPKNAQMVKEVLQRQSELIALAKKKEIPILLVEYSGYGSTDKAITREMDGYSKARTFVKRTDDLFGSLKMTEAVKKFLDKHGVSELLMTGANGGACVRCSIEGALDLDYGVWTDEHAIADFDLKDFIYPYHYEDGSLRLEKAGNIKKLNQLKSIDEVEAMMDSFKGNAVDLNAESAPTKPRCRAKEMVDFVLKKFFINDHWL